MTGAERVLLSPEEAAEALAISRTAVYALCSAGTLPSVKIGRRRRVPVEALKDLVTALQRAQAGEAEA